MSDSEEPSEEVSSVVQASRSVAADNDTVFMVLLIGLTGSGKSTFINLAGGLDLRTSPLLTSCTQEVKAAPGFEIEGRRICLIDTPGFDDTDRSEVEILKDIKDFLKYQYNAGTLLHGIIYLQRISDVRMGGVSTRTLRVLRNLCGSDSLKNMRIVTNMWSKEATVEEQNRERQLRDDERFFKLFLDDRAQMVRHDNTVESARKIIRDICTNTPSVLDIQRETVDQRKPLSATSAGIMLRSGLLEPAQGLQVLVDALRDRVKAARAEEDQVKVAELGTEIRAMIPGLARLYNELQNLQVLTDKKVDFMPLWNGIDSKAKIVAVFRRSYGIGDNQELNGFWAALGDTVSFFREMLASFEECPLPLSVHDQLLQGTGVLTQEANEKLDKWFSDNRKEIAVIRGKVDDLVTSKAGAKYGARNGKWAKRKLAKFGAKLRGITGKRLSSQ